ncbi:hypothetical protein ALC57_01920 [Trachymyrmex cornetzi]|uniref:Uncharacterized protein n=1 Tax=Trachymyrmex cornetzi TaxID=471704 RepID=A0A195EL53_9HYME|nr:hypothetical protein ALC57_01920 [Trachymyrmex cornetzi]
MKFEINRIAGSNLTFIFRVVRHMYMYMYARVRILLIQFRSWCLSLTFKISLQRVLWILMFWIIGVLMFLRYAWTRVTRLFIHGFQERGISGASLPGKLAVLVRGDFHRAMGIMNAWKGGRIIYAYLLWVVFKATTAGGLYGEYTSEENRCESFEILELARRPAIGIVEIEFLEDD